VIVLHVPTFSLAAAASFKSPWQSLAPRARLLAAVALVLAAVALPRGAWPYLAAHAGLTGALVLASRVPLGLLLGRLGVEFLFVGVLFASILFSGRGEPLVALGPLVIASVSLRDCLDALAKALLSLAVLNLLVLTTPAPTLLAALAELGCPRLLVAVLESMLRYLAVLVDELGSMQRAARARGSASALLDWATLGNILGALFLRTYGRGERVHQAMLARGFRGDFPPTERRALGVGEWLAVIVPCLLLIGACALHFRSPL